MVEGDAVALEDMRAFLGFAQLVLGAPRDDDLAMLDVRLEHLAQRERARLPFDERDVVDAEGRLQRRVLVELVEDELWLPFALELDDQAHAFTVALVAQVGDADDLLVGDQLGDGLDELGLVELEGDGGDDDGLAAAAQLLELVLSAHHDRAAAGQIALTDALAPEYERAGREVRAGDDLEQFFVFDRAVVDDGGESVTDLGEVVRRDVRRHADRDARRAVDEQVGQTRRQEGWLARGSIVVGDEVNRLFVQVGHHLGGDLCQPCFGVAHGGRRIAVDGSEVAVAVDQRVAQAEILGHAHERVVDRDVAVWMIFLEDLADGAGALAVRLVGIEAQLRHGVEDAPVDRLEAVADVGQGACHDDAHGVIEVRAAHLVFDVDGQQTVRRRGVLVRFKGHIAA